MKRKQISQLLHTKCMYMNMFAPKNPWCWCYCLHLDGYVRWSSGRKGAHHSLLPKSMPLSCAASFLPRDTRSLTSYRYIKKENISVLPVIPFRKNKASTLFLIISHLPNFPNPPLLWPLRVFFFFIFAIILVNTKFSTAPTWCWLVALLVCPQKHQEHQGNGLRIPQHACLFKELQVRPTIHCPWFRTADENYPRSAPAGIPLLYILQMRVESFVPLTQQIFIPFGLILKMSFKLISTNSPVYQTVGSVLWDLRKGLARTELDFNTRPCSIIV